MHLDAVRASGEAYVHGWVLSGGPITERLYAGIEAAVKVAVERHDQPDVLEVSLHLGHLEGTWAKVYERREDLTAKLAKRVGRQWRSIVKGLDSLDLVRTYRRHLLMREADGDGKPSAADTASAKSASLAWLQQVLSSPEYRELAQEIADAIIASMAEGKTAALGVAADQAAKLGFDWAKAYNAMYAGLAALQNLPEMEAPWVQAIIQAAGADAGKLMATMAAAGASDEEIADALWGASADDAVMLAIDTAISGSMARGALDLYASEGVLVGWMTAGDGRVCAVPCQDNEDNGPYEASMFPECPAHPRCVIGSTRISVPAATVMAAEVNGGLPGARIDPAADGLPATAAAIAERDFGRGNIRAVSDREYVGDVITIRTALGHELTATPNHPVATRRGWVPIAELAVGDHVLASTRPEWVTQGVDPDVDDVPPCIEQVAETFAVQLGPMPTAPEDFHGDGAGSDVHVVRSDRLLVDDGQPGIAKHSGEHQLGGRRVAPGGPLPLHAESPGPEELFALGLPARSIVGGASQPGAFLGAGLGHAQVHGLAAPPGLDAGVKQAVTDDRAIGAERLSQGLLALSGEVAGDDRGAIDRHLLLALAPSPRAHLNASLPQPIAHVAGTDPEGFREGIAALAGEVAADELVHVERHGFSGHVYNLDTSAGWYIGNGIVTHNCRCSPYPYQGLPLSAFAAFLDLAA